VEQFADEPSSLNASERWELIKQRRPELTESIYAAPINSTSIPPYLERMDRLAAEMGADMQFLLHRGQTDPAFSEAIRAVGQQTGSTIIPAPETFFAEPIAEYSFRDQHYDRRGNRILAAHLYDHVAAWYADGPGRIP